METNRLIAFALKGKGGLFDARNQAHPAAQQHVIMAWGQGRGVGVFFHRAELNWKVLISSVTLHA